MNRQSLLVILLLLLALNLSDLFVVGSAQDSQIFEGQQLILRPVGKGSYTELFDVECKNRRAIALDETKVKRQGKQVYVGLLLMWTLKRFLVFIFLRRDLVLIHILS